MKKIASFITSVCFCISLVGCAKTSSTVSNNIGNTTLNESKAITMVVKDNTDFPSNQSDTIIRKLPTGGSKIKERGENEDKEIRRHCAFQQFRKGAF